MPQGQSQCAQLCLVSVAMAQQSCTHRQDTKISLTMAPEPVGLPWDWAVGLCEAGNSDFFQQQLLLPSLFSLVAAAASTNFQGSPQLSVPSTVKS